MKNRKLRIAKAEGTEIKMQFKQFYSCPNCGRAISGEKREYFVCPNCGRAVCKRENLEACKDKYCGNCGNEIASAIKEALALAQGEN